ncbi:MAG: SPOR domain-containing protein [Phycisphaeraceae bacterium]|nr:SPOR domain-containing protein [Phycisphaeraceae bacterium]
MASGSRIGSRLVGAGCLSALLLGSGCAGSTAQRASYVEQYEQGRYTQASVNAIRVVRDSGAPDRDLARLTAGLSAHALGRNDEASVWLRPLTERSDDQIAGKALAALGLIALEDGEDRTAAKLLSRAAGKLRGDDSAHAALFAGDAYSNLGSFEAARLQYRLAQSSAKDPGVKALVASRLGEGFTLQVGAFANRGNAERTRRRIEQDSVLDTLGEPTVLARKDNRGGTLYLVRVGHFHTERDARAAQLRTGVGGIITLASAEDTAG